MCFSIKKCFFFSYANHILCICNMLNKEQIFTKYLVFQKGPDLILIMVESRSLHLWIVPKWETWSNPKNILAVPGGSMVSSHMFTYCHKLPCCHLPFPPVSSFPYVFLAPCFPPTLFLPHYMLSPCPKFPPRPCLPLTSCFSFTSRFLLALCLPLASCFPSFLFPSYLILPSRPMFSSCP